MVIGQILQVLDKVSNPLTAFGLLVLIWYKREQRLEQKATLARDSNGDNPTVKAIQRLGREIIKSGEDTQEFVSNEFTLNQARQKVHQDREEENQRATLEELRGIRESLLRGPGGAA
jgi:hypothetical protein